MNCIYENCKLPKSSSMGYCSGHQMQIRRGKELSPLKTQETLQERIERKSIRNDSGCLVWTGHVDTAGYPNIKWKNINYLVHRIYYKILVENIERHDTLDHICRNKLCIEPTHLEPVSRSENIKRMQISKYYETEIKRLVDFIESLGYDSKTLLKE